MGAFISRFTGGSSGSGGSSGDKNYLNLFFVQGAITTHDITTIDNNVLTVIRDATGPSNVVQAKSDGYMFFGVRGVTSINLVHKDFSSTYPYEFVTQFGSYDFSYMPDLVTAVFQNFTANSFNNGNSLFIISNNPKLTTISIGMVNDTHNYGLDNLPRNMIQSNAKLDTVNFDVGSAAINLITSCPLLTTVNFTSHLRSMDSGAFRQLSSLAFTININRASGAVSGAPWGATNATINWTGTT